MPLETTAGNVRLDRIEFAKVNREEMDDSEIDKLAATMTEFDLINAVTLTPHPNKKDWYICVAGERRIRAARKLKWKEIKAEIRHDLTDAQIRELRLVENLARADLTVWDEAAQLVDLKKTMPDARVEDIALRIGRGADWVACRLAVDSLIPDLQKIVRDQDWPLACMPLLARVPVASQPQIVEEIKIRQKGRHHEWVDDEGRRDKPKAPTARVLRRLLDSLQNLLTSAKWNLDDATLVPAAGACNVCPKRSSVEPMLFADEQGKVEKGDRCLDAECWNGKAKALVVLNLSKLREAGEKPIVMRSGYEEIEKPLLKAFGVKETERTHGYNEVKKGADGAKPAIVADGDKMGEVIYIRLWSHGSENGSGRKKKEIDQETGKPKPPSTKVRQTALRQKRQCRAVELWSEAMEKLAPEFVGVVDNLIVAFGSKRTYDYQESYDGNPWSKQAKLVKAKPVEFSAVAWAQVFPVLQSRVKRMGPMETNAVPLWNEAVRQARAIGEEKQLVECWKAAVAEIKLPKVLERDGVKDNVAAPK